MCKKWIARLFIDNNTQCFYLLLQKREKKLWPMTLIIYHSAWEVFELYCRSGFELGEIQPYHWVGSLRRVICTIQTLFKHYALGYQLWGELMQGYEAGGSRAFELLQGV
jgi:hypothetical protein